MQTILITGLSGAGRSTALRILEDQGFMALDNIPLSYVDAILSKKTKTPFVLGLDCRNLDFQKETFCELVLALMQKHASTLKSLFLTCDEQTLLRRYTESRRRHPLNLNSLKECIFQEKKLLTPLQLECEYVIDTSQISRSFFHQKVQDLFLKEGPKDLKIQLMSFSYRTGVPQEADFIFDMRFLQNPYYYPTLKEKNGLDQEVREFIHQDPLLEEYKKSVQTVLSQSITGFEKNGRNYVTIAFGCTGGQHRSVFMADHFYNWFKKTFSYAVCCTHRELSSIKKGALVTPYL